MKTLYKYILESRKRLNELSFDIDLFTHFMEDAIIDMNYDDSKYWGLMKDNIIKNYGNKVWRWFYGWCESYLEIQNRTSIEEFYNSIKNTPLDRINRVIGAGSNGIVLTFNDRVIKIFYEDKIKSIDEPFIKYCYNRDSKVFPKVYKIGKNWCVMERLKTHTDKCILYMDIIDNCKIDGFDFISSIAKGKHIKSPSKLSEEQLEVYEWCISVKKEMENINSKYISYPGDLVLNNIGERDNGDIVFFDV